MFFLYHSKFTATILQSRSHKEPKLLARAEVGINFWLRLRVRKISILKTNNEQVPASNLIGILPKNYENSTFSVKSRVRPTSCNRSQLWTRRQNFLKVRARAEKNSFVSATLYSKIHIL
jgi:hypothetical protein